MVNEHNVVPSAAFYAEYLGRLLIEGADDSVEEFLDNELDNLGLADDRGRIEEVLNRARGQNEQSTDNSLSKLRVSLIKKWSHVGEDGRDAIRQLFGALVRRRKVDVNVFNAILRLCYDSESQEEVLSNMEALGVQPNIVSYTTLLTRLRVEGDEDAAHRLFESRLPALRVEPDSHFFDVLNLGQSPLSRMRRAQMNVFSLAGEDGRSAAWRLHAKLLKNNRLDAAVARSMYSLCAGTEEYTLVSQSMKSCGGISLEDQQENEAWCRRNRPMREYFIGTAGLGSTSAGDVSDADSRNSSAAVHFARLIRDPLTRIGV